MLDLRDHASHGGCVFKLTRAVTLVQSESDKRRTLVSPAPDGASCLGDPESLLCSSHDLSLRLNGL